MAKITVRLLLLPKSRFWGSNIIHHLPLGSIAEASALETLMHTITNCPLLFTIYIAPSLQKFPTNKPQQRSHCSKSILKQCLKVSVTPMMSCGSYPGVWGDLVLWKCPRADRGNSRGALPCVTYLCLWHVCMSKLPWLLNISLLFPLKVHLPVIRTYMLIKISKLPEISLSRLMMNGTNECTLKNLNCCPWLFLDMQFTHNSL